MKKILFFLMVGIILSNTTQAQLVSLKSLSNGTSLDTVSNTGSKILYAKVIGYKESITATVTITSISGTLGGSLIPVVSNDGINFYNGTANTLSDSAFTVTNTATQGKAFTFKRGFQYYGVQWTGTGTMSGSFLGWLLARKQSD
jgi:hypothetical protein